MCGRITHACFPADCNYNIHCFCPQQEQSAQEELTMACVNNDVDFVVRWLADHPDEEDWQVDWPELLSLARDCGHGGMVQCLEASGRIPAEQVLCFVKFRTFPHNLANQYMLTCRCSYTPDVQGL